ncbi:O-antigen ligase family protein [Enterobacter cancerogenus]
MRQRNSLHFTCFPAVILLVCVTLPFAGSAGPGLLGGNNLQTWSCVVLWCSVLWCLRNTCAPRGLVIGGLAVAVLMTLPLIWTTLPAWQLNALPRLVGLWAGVGLFLLLLHVRFGMRGRMLLVSALAASAFIQALMALSQLLFPLSPFVRDMLHYDVLSAQGRALGSLGQVNLLGSFLATGAGAALWCLLSLPVRRRSLRLCGWLALALILAALTVARSRTGWLGGMLACAGVLWLTGRYCAWRALAGCVLLAGMLAAGVFSLQPRIMVAAARMVSPPSADTFSLDRMRGESRERRLQMLRVTAELIKQHPLAGSGLGSFERRWSDGLASLGEVSATPERVIYPHNELLYVWAEGGAVALGGLLLAGALWMFPALSFICRRRRPGATRRYASLWPLSLPLALHVMTEFPFYLSALHFVLFLLLWRLAVPDGAGRAGPARGAWLGLPVGLAGFAILAVCAANLGQLHKVERSGFSSPLTLYLPWASEVLQADRLQFDRCVSLLIAYNQSRDIKLLEAFSVGAGAYLTAHSDPNLMDSLIRVDTALGFTRQAQQIHHRAQVSFPADPRFSPEGVRP